MKLFLVPAFAAAIVLACIGWGRLVERAVASRGSGQPLESVSTGTAACLGLATFLCGSGVFVALNQYRPVFAWLWILAGCGLAAHGYLQRRDRTEAALPRGIAVATVGVLALAAIWQTGNSLGIFRWNPCDDFAAYLPLLHRLGDTGGLIEPFSIRRIAGLGGATTFDSLFTQPFGLQAAYVGDFVVGTLLIGLMLLVPSRSWTRFALGLLLTVSLLLWQILKANLTPAYIAAALIAAAVLVVVETRRTRANLLDLRVLALLGLLSAGLLTLRTPDVVSTVLFVLVLIAVAAATLRDRLRAALFFGATIVACAAPWMMALWRSSGTPLYPPIAGNFNNDWPGLTVSGGDLPTRLGDALGADPLLWMLAGTIITGICLLALRRGGEWSLTPLIALVVAELTAGALVVLTGAAAHDVARYTWPFVSGVLIASIVILAREVELPPLGRPDRAAALGLVAIAIAIPLISPLGAEIDSGATGVANVISGDDDSLVTLDRFKFEYGAAQDSIPAGAKAAIAADTPWYFDYDRNNLVNLDQLGAVSPPPHMPLGGTVDQVTGYLRDQGFRYVIATDPKASICLYTPRGWRYDIRHDKEEKNMAPDFFDWFRWERQRERQAPARTTHYASLVVYDLRG